MDFDIVLGISWVGLSFRVIGLAIYRVHTIMKYVLNLNPPAVVHIERGMDGLWECLTVAAICATIHEITANLCAIFITPKVLIDRRKTIHVWETTRCQDKRLRTRSRCMSLPWRFALVTPF